MSVEQYRLLKNEVPSYQVEENLYDRQAILRRLKANKLSILLLIALNFSLAYSLALTISFHHNEHDIGRSPFSGLGYDTPTLYRAHTDYWSENETLADELWSSVDTSPVGIALTEVYAEQHGLPIAGRFPWDVTRGTYFIKVFHQLHCLKLMRKMAVDLKDGVESVITWEHYQHCLDALSQDITCRADDAPMYGKVGSHLGDGQIVMCRDWNKLIAWTQAPEQNACYRSLDDYKTIKHNLERYAFCPPTSPYYEVSRAYFEKWGHVDPFVE